MVPRGDLRVGGVRVCTVGVWFRVERRLRRWRAERTAGRVARQAGSLSNFSEGETTEFVFAEWVDAETISRSLRDTPRDAEFFGDVYASA